MISPYTCSITINGTGIQGLSQLSIDNDNALERVEFAGFDFYDKIQSSQVIPQISFSRKDYDQNVDIIRSLTGDFGCSGDIIYLTTSGYKKVSFNNAYLNQYAASFSLEATPTYSYKFSVFGPMLEAGASAPINANVNQIDLNRGNIKLSSTRFSGFIVNDINYSMDIQRRPVFSIRTKQYAAVKRIKPIEVSVNVSYYAKNLSPTLFASLQQGNGNPKDIVNLEVRTDGGVFKDRLSGIMNVESDNVSVSTEGEIMIQSAYSTFLPKTLF